MPGQPAPSTPTAVCSADRTLRLNENSIDLADAEVQNTGPLAGYAFRDRTQPNQQRWVLYSHDGHARVFTDSRDGDVVTFAKDGLVSTSGPQAGFQVFDRRGPAKGAAIWYVDNDSATLEFTGPVANGQVVKRTPIGANNATGVTIFSHARVTGRRAGTGWCHSRLAWTQGPAGFMPRVPPRNIRRQRSVFSPKGGRGQQMRCASNMQPSETTNEGRGSAGPERGLCRPRRRSAPLYRAESSLSLIPRPPP